jgi:hypothetical protein
MILPWGWNAEVVLSIVIVLVAPFAQLVGQLVASNALIVTPVNSEFISPE